MDPSDLLGQLRNEVRNGLLPAVNPPQKILTKTI